MLAVGTWRGGHETLLEDGRAHTVTVDLPVDEGGRSAGPTATDLMLLSLAGGLSTVFVLVARKRRLAFRDLAIALEAERPSGADTLSRVRGTLRLRTAAAGSEVEEALRRTVRACPVSVVFERAGIPVEIVPLVVPLRPVPEADGTPRKAGRRSRAAG